MPNEEVMVAAVMFDDLVVAEVGDVVELLDVGGDVSGGSVVAATEVEPLVEMIVNGHRYPAFAVNGRWELLAANDASTLFLASVDDDLLAPPINVVRLSLHERGLAPRILNFDEYARHMLRRLRRLDSYHPELGLSALVDEFGHLDASDAPDVRTLALPLEFAVTPTTAVRLISTSTTFGAPHDITLAELAIESFYPADEASRTTLDRHLAG